jgi:hypothetical protein
MGYWRRAEFEDTDIKYHFELKVCVRVCECRVCVCARARNARARARQVMNKSGAVKLPRHNEAKSDLGMFKKNQSHINYYGLKLNVYCYPLRYRFAARLQYK